MIAQSSNFGSALWLILGIKVQTKSTSLTIGDYRYTLANECGVEICRKSPQHDGWICGGTAYSEGQARDILAKLENDVAELNPALWYDTDKARRARRWAK